MSTVDKDFKVKNGLVVTEGGAFGGPVTVGTPTLAGHAVTKEYLELFGGGGGSSSVEVSDTPPSTPSEGDLWFNSSDGSFYIYYDSFWVDVSGGGGSSGGTSIEVSDTEPSNPAEGSLWLDTTINRIKFYYNEWLTLANYNDTLTVPEHTHDTSIGGDRLVDDTFLESGGPATPYYTVLDGGTPETTDWSDTYSGGILV